VWVVRLGG
jgi:hypothetical protein